MSETKELDDVLAGITKDFGKGAVMLLGEKQPDPVDVVSTGSLGLDIALGVGGLPRGRIVEIYGPESSGKTTLATNVIAEAQKLGGKCAIIDVEHAFDSKYAEQLGVDVDNLLIAQPDYGEQALEIADRLISSGKLAVVVIDSVAALVPKAELDGEMGENKMGAQARLMSQALRKMTANVNKSNTICIFINQLREKIGVMFGSPETTTGGNALKFYSSVRLDVRRYLSAEKVVKNGDQTIGSEVKVRVIKNKVAPPLKEALFDIIWGTGIDKLGELLTLGHKYKILRKWGKDVTVYSEFEEDPIKYTIEEFPQVLLDNPEFAQNLRRRIVNASMA
jgi:recombination protein RecA